ncbi:MAG: oligosaccharide flippase family protein [Flavobacteriaceae bacterium]|nr:oligosaccharide flippase family protein [Flavobacteriaceae bacterium]MCY4267115.1 oligosaccharide flippase family protein [Flavobacteriaceae bacterium]
MSLVAKQSFVNILSICLALLLGAINTLYLYPNELGEEYHGLVISILVFSNLIQPFISLGLQHAIIRYFSSIKSQLERDRLFWFSMWLPLLLIVFGGLCLLLNHKHFISWLMNENEIFGTYLWMILGIAIATAYFEILYNWSRVQLKTVFGNFLKELYPRLVIFLLLLSYVLTWIDFSEFLLILFGAYYFRLLLIISFNLSIHIPRFSLRLPNKCKEILRYSFLIFLSAVAATYNLDIDKAQINHFLGNQIVAYYSVALYIAAVIEIPFRSLSQIVSPLVAKAINTRNKVQLKSLLTKSADSQLIVSGFLFVLVLINIEELYQLVSQPGYATALGVVFIVSFGKLYSASLGCINLIMTNSKHYVYVFWFSIASAVLAIILNIYFIQWYGMFGAAYATLIVMIITNSLKLLLLAIKFEMVPYSKNTLAILILIGLSFFVFYFIGLDFNPIQNIAIQSLILSLLFFFTVLKFKLSSDLIQFYNDFKNKVLNPKMK